MDALFVWRPRINFVRVYFGLQDSDDLCLQDTCTHIQGIAQSSTARLGRLQQIISLLAEFGLVQHMV